MGGLLLGNQRVVLPIIAQSRHLFNAVAFSCRFLMRPHGFWSHSYHLVLPHDSLRKELLAAEPTRGSGSPRKWCPVTPAMAAGMTDHVWTIDELLGYRVPAPFLDTLNTIEHLFPALDHTHHVN